MSNKFAGGVKAGSTSVSASVLLRKTADNTELTAVAFGSVTATYRRQGAASVAITTSALGAITSAYSSGGWIEADATNQPGTYRLDVPDAAFATGADWVIVAIKVASAFVFYERYNLETQGASDVYAQLPANFAALGITVGGKVSEVALCDAVSGAVGSVTGNVGGSVGGSVASVTAPVSINLTQTGLTPRALDAVADAALTVGDGLVAAICGAAGQETVAGTTYSIKTPFTGTVIRAFTLNSSTTPTQRN